MGAREIRPSDFIRVKAGDSCRRRRIQTEITSSSTEIRKGRRQPQDSKASWPRVARVPSTTTSDRNMPVVAVVWIQLVKKPRRWFGACSAT